MKSLTAFVSALCTATALAAAVQAAPITHSASSFGGTFTNPFGTLQTAVGTAFINDGVNYSYGNVEGVFNDPPPAFCGINSAGICDLLTAVDAQIVELGTTSQGLTSFVEVTAGNANAGTLLLEVFDINATLLASIVNPTNGTSSFSITRALADIAFFRISGNDTYGVPTVTIETPVAPVPEPASMALLGLGMAGLGWRRRHTA